MLSMILLAASTLTSAQAALPPASSAGSLPSRVIGTVGREECPSASVRIIDESRKGLRARRLGELPPGQLELSVLREVDGCPIPAVVREDLGEPLNPAGRPLRR